MSMLDEESLPVSQAIRGEIIRSEAESIGEVKDLLRHLSPIQIKYVIGMMYHKNQADALMATGIDIAVVRSWPREIRDVIDKAISMIAWDTVQFARQLMKEYVLQAVLVKISGLNSEDELVRQKTATELIEWESGKAKTRMQIDQNTTHHVKMYSTVSPDDWDEKPDDDQ